MYLTKTPDGGQAGATAAELSVVIPTHDRLPILSATLRRLFAQPDVYRVVDMVEKPGKANAPSNLGIIGRYVLTPDIFEHIAATRPGRGGEIQLTDAMKAQAREESIRAVKFSGVRYDVGSKQEYLRAVVELAANREDLGPEFREFLIDYVKGL
jgi:UTP--glucose-1-phosphate uridylyltransferase